MSAEDFSSDEEVESHQYKVILLGDGSVGKTSITSRFAHDAFQMQYKQTVGVDFALGHIILPGDVRVTLQIWDIGGQNIGSKMLGRYISGAKAVLLVFDVTNYESFQNLEDWYRLVQQTFIGQEMPYVALVGNKVDLEHMRAVTRRKQEQFATENDMFVFEVSAKTGYRVGKVFQRVAADLSGMALTRKQVEAATNIVHAEVVQYPQHDPAVPATALPKSKPCVIS